jgi:curved DNA-binding protein CbpA
MDQKELDEVARFLQGQGRSDLFAYYELSQECSAAEADEAVRKRRRWAQGQQSNPKYKSEALFVIKNNGFLSQLMTRDLEAYRTLVRSQSAANPLETFLLQLRRAVESGPVTAAVEAGLLQKGRELGLKDPVIQHHLSLYTETTVREPGELSAEDLSVDHYRVLEVSPDATDAEIDEAYRARYRKARNLKDTKQSADILMALDRAIGVLKKPEARRHYDDYRRRVQNYDDDTTGVFEVVVPQKAAAPSHSGRGAPGPAPAKPAGPGEDYVADHLLRDLPQPTSTAVLPERDPFADRDAPREKVHKLDEDENTIIRDPFSAGGSLNPTVIYSQMPEKPAEPDEDSDVGAVRRPVPPPPPPEIQASTLGVAQEPVVIRSQDPRLVVDGPLYYTLENPTTPLTIQVKVRNDGAGRMPGQVIVRGDGIDVDRMQLNPDMREQVLVLTVVPQRLPAGSSTATVRIQGAHGEWRDVTIQVQRPEGSGRPLPLLIGLVAVLLVLIAGAVWVFGGFGKELPPVPVSLEVSPYAEQLVVDGVAREGSGSRLSLERPPGKATVVELTTQGFKPVKVTIPPADAAVSRRVELEPDVDMTGPPPASAGVGAARPDLAGEVTKNAAVLGTCFRGGGTLTPRFSAWIYGSSGMVLWVDLDPVSAPQADITCVRRIFRGMRVTPFPQDDAVVTVGGVSIQAGP